VELLFGVAVLASALGGIDPLAQDQDDLFSVRSLSRLVVADDRQSRYGREWACTMLAGTDPPPKEALAALIAAMRDTRPENERARAACARAIAVLGPSAAPAIDALVSFLDEDVLSKQWQEEHSPQEHGRAFEQVIKALGAIGPAAVPALVERLDFRPDRQGENTNPAWAGASESLGLIGTPAIPALLQALKNSAKRYGAIDALGNVGGVAAEESVPALTALSTDPDALVRWRVMTALQHIGPAASLAVPVLIQALEDPDQSVRSEAVLALETIGPPAAAAVPVLKKLLSDEHLGYSQKIQVQHALEKIERR